MTYDDRVDSVGWQWEKRAQTTRLALFGAKVVVFFLSFAFYLI